MRITAEGRSLAKKSARLAVALSGTAIAGLALVPAASATTTAPARSTPGAVPNVSNCYTHTDFETYAEGYCSEGPGRFYTFIVCDFGSSQETINGPIQLAGAHRTSRAQCPVNWFYDYADTIPAP
jgi:hypothetical protein